VGLGFILKNIKIINTSYIYWLDLINKTIMSQDRVDELGDAYNKGVVAGQEHSQPSKKTIEMIKDLEIKTNDRIEGVENRLSEKIDTKVSFVTFTWVLGIAMTVVTGMFYLVYNEVKDSRSEIDSLRVNFTETSNNVSYIRGVLNNADIVQ
jgi:hypothetical protein